METPLSGSTARLNDNVTFGGRYTYNFMKQLGIQLSAGYTPTHAAHVGSGDSDLGLTTVDLDAIWYVIPDYSLAGHQFSAYTEAGAGYAWAEARRVQLSDSARLVMTDFTREPPATVTVDRTIDDAERDNPTACVASESCQTGSRPAIPCHRRITPIP